MRTAWLRVPASAMSDRPANGSGYPEPASVDIDAATRRLMSALDALESSVERRRSLYHKAAVIFSPSPRRIEPLSTAWPARLPS